MKHYKEIRLAVSLAFLALAAYHIGRRIGLWLAILVLICCPGATSAVTFQIQNAGPCNLTNFTGYAVMTGKSGGFSGTVSQPAANLGTFSNGCYNVEPGVSAICLSSGGWGVVGSSAKFAIYAGPAGAYRLLGEQDVPYPGTQTYTYQVWPVKCGPTDQPCQTNNIPKTVKNTYSYYGIAVWYQDGILKYSQQLGPNQSATYTYQFCTKITDPPVNLSYGMSYDETGIISDGTGGYDIVDNGTTGTQTHDTGNTNKPTDPGGNYDGYSNTNAIPQGNLTNNTAINLTNAYPILWNNPDTTAARDATLKAGFNKIAQQNQSIINGTALIAQTLQNGGLSNNTSVNVTVTNNITITNNFPTNALYEAYYNGGYTALTNLGGLTNDANTHFGTTADNINGVTNGFLLANGGSTTPTYSFTFMNQTVDFNPFTRWPSIGIVSKWAWGLSAIVAFMMWAGRTIHKDVVGQFAGMEMGGVPNMSMEGTILGVGGGGNFLGMIIALLIPAIFVALFVAVCVGGATMMTSAVSGYFSSYVGNAGVPGTFWYIANELVPVALIFGLTVARATIPFVLGSVVGAGVAVARFLPGK